MTTLEQKEKIDTLKRVEEELLQLIERVSNSPNDRPEYLRAVRLLNQTQLMRINTEVQELK